MKEILIVGSGAREHSLVWKARQSSSVGNIYCAPGNPGIAEIAECIPIKATNVEQLAKFAKQQKIDLTIIGPEDPLAFGIVDHFKSQGLRIFGPSQQAAQIESSKIFAKNLMDEADLPTARYKTFKPKEQGEAEDYIECEEIPIVVKQDGLAAGKGAVVAESKSEAKKVAKEFLDIGIPIIIEEFLEGYEVSLIALCNGTQYFPLILSQDHKKAYDGDKGPNTGGLGVYAPLNFIGAEEAMKLYKIVTDPTLRALANKGIHFRGILYSNVMITKNGPKILEHNARFGDPECQTILPLYDGDLINLIENVLSSDFDQIPFKWNGKFGHCVVLASRGYPSNPETGKIIEGIEDAIKIPGVLIFQAGTKIENGKLVTSGGRVLCTVGIGDTLQEAAKRSYYAASKINFDGKHIRTDIGKQGLKFCNYDSEVDIV
ncbi:MAG: phosphoribosylamine--glycine ligase [Candidatus Blackburnbacteria bacterium RIFCSPHIGHO2_02_FULL_39_13]|nr:MAG: Phosphoribosylamine-glycine ligase [Microgenomates group bacterium GW2011_GWA2_39_19]OGY06808.1 MAG: phosphoribosylamine--glycine ligase [Candidatus Blackburnbacteria bacterium RIFCSPHIGHO2_01_FULL_40_17]OGY09010.1 MAG: phosphoribosylamine--glycine ligase [Candidatus Blackburnbacteria bacterium RIFCSPHIGHO2_02_FULL_39_13]HBL51631.1 phosphoribosylamine--glycine ligase [Candidatus Blackburnbacteria bacterium]